MQKKRGCSRSALGSLSEAATVFDPERLIVKIKPHVSKGKRCSLAPKAGDGSSGVDSDGLLRIATNLLDVPAEILALLYAYRWTIEIFYQPPAAASVSSNISSAAVTC